MASSAQTPMRNLPPELVILILAKLRAQILARFARIGVAYHRGTTEDDPPLVQEALRQRALESGRALPTALPVREASWVQFLLAEELASQLHGRRVVACGIQNSVLMHDGRLLDVNTIVSKVMQRKNEFLRTVAD